MNQTDIHGRPLVCYGDLIHAAQRLVLHEPGDRFAEGYNSALTNLIHSVFGTAKHEIREAIDIVWKEPQE